jgi:hypothetical protein
VAEALRNQVPGHGRFAAAGQAANQNQLA